MAVTHHFIVQWAARLIGRKYFRNYAILGDDLVIADKAVALSYIALLKRLDMPISSAKSLVSEKSLEFAKRLFIRGVEVTPYSSAGLDSSLKRYYLIGGFLDSQANHG